MSHSLGGSDYSTERVDCTRDLRAPFEKWIYKKISAEEKLKEFEEALTIKLDALSVAIEKIESHNHQLVLISRYLNDMRWEDIPRYVAKNIVASGIAKKCEIQVAYAIGVAKPVSIYVDTFGTSKYTNDQILEAVNKFFNFSPKAIKNEIIDDSVSFKALAEYGHVGRTDIYVPWERTNKAYILKAYFNEKYNKAKYRDSSLL